MKRTFNLIRKTIVLKPLSFLSLISAKSPDRYKRYMFINAKYYLFLLFTYIFLLFPLTPFAQPPMKLSYQAVIRNTSNQLLINKQIGIQISILKGSASGIPVYVETQTPSTNENGLVNIEIGSGTSSDDLSAIDWTDGPYFIKTEIDPEGGTTYSVTGISQLLSVPYALHAKTSESLSEGITESDPVFNTWDKSTGISITESQISNFGSYLTVEYDPVFSIWDKSTGISIKENQITDLKAYLTTELDGSVTNELQTLNISNDSIFLTDGGNIKLPVTVKNAVINFDSLYISFTDGVVVNAGYVGHGSPGSTVATVSTNAVVLLGYTKATIYAEITNPGNELILSRGVCYSTASMPSLNNDFILTEESTAVFQVNLTGLFPGTIYYVRAFATNTVGTSYGNELSFTTQALTVPTISTSDVYNISHTSAMGGGNISDDGGSEITERGICWSTNPDPSVANDKFIAETPENNFNALLSGLTSNSTYYVKAYASNAQGTAYGNELSFTTLTLSLASIITGTVSNISYTTAVCGGNVTSDNGSSITSRGICWNLSPNPTTDNFVYSEAGGLGIFTGTMTSLSPNTKYYVRAFAINEAGTVYGEEYNFTTLALTTPVLTTKAISGISSNFAGSGGNITSDGGSGITAKGVVWSINSSPTLTNSFTDDGTGSASYNSTMTGLIPLTKYYVKAYATNSSGTTYGNELNFTTTDLVIPEPTIPTVGTSPSAITGSSTASSGGYISSDGGSDIIARGVCWNTSQNPTLDNNFSEDGTGIGYFSSTVTGLSGCGTIYYIRAYTTNSIGTAYGTQNTVSTGLVGAVTTNEVTDIDFYTATCGGNVTDDGNCPVTQKGVCWNWQPNPTVNNPHTNDGPGGGSFVSYLTGLKGNITYYVRAYVTNSVGTSYGPQIVFTTLTPPTPYIGQNYAGGIVFYIDETGQHGLVCAPSNQSAAPWGCAYSNIATNTAFGTGAANTATIIATCPTAGIAARVADDLVLNDYSDWFLPSKDELALILQNLNSVGLGNLSSGYIWSSSQSNADFAWGLYNGNLQQYLHKTQTCAVRAIRPF